MKAAQLSFDDRLSFTQRQVTGKFAVLAQTDLN
jgi:hypothetical protein